MTLDLEALKRVAEAATPGPWEVSDADVRTSAFVRARGFGHVCNAPVPIHDWYEREANRESQARKNIAHIATFDPPTVLALIARLEAAEKAAQPIVGSADDTVDKATAWDQCQKARAVGFEEGARAMRNKLQADIDAERGKIVADGYDYKSGEEHGLARAVRIIRYADPAALTSAPAPEVEAMAGEGGR